MNREHVAFLFGGFAFGMLIGFGLFYVAENQPELNLTSSGVSSDNSPRGPAAPTQRANEPGGSGAPMLAEINRLKGRLQEQPNDLATLARLGGIYHEAGMWQQAAGYYERAIGVEPGSADLLTDLAVCYRGMQEFDRALETFDRANGAQPTHWRSMFNKAIVAFEIGRIDVALAAIERIESMQPRPADLDGARVTELRSLLERARPAAGEAS